VNKQKDNSGIMFRNADKKTENQPDGKGRINVGGTEYWLSGWKKTGKGGPYWSFAVGDPVESQDKPGAGAENSWEGW